MDDIPFTKPPSCCPACKTVLHRFYPQCPVPTCKEPLTPEALKARAECAVAAGLGLVKSRDHKPQKGKHPMASQPAPFIDYLRQLDKGHFSAELSEKFQVLIQCVAEHGKPGSITVKVSLKPQSDMDSGVVTALAEVKVNAPEPKRTATIFYVDEDFNLSRRDPRQRDLEDMMPAKERTS